MLKCFTNSVVSPAVGVGRWDSIRESMGISADDSPNRTNILDTKLNILQNYEYLIFIYSCILPDHCVLHYLPKTGYKLTCHRRISYRGIHI